MGFTMIELLVVMAIMGLLTSLVITYSRTGERQIVLFKDQASLISLLIKARSLSVGTLGEVVAPCGYGVNFNESGSVIIFKDSSPGNDPKCLDADNVYNSGEEKVEEFILNPALKFDELDLADIVFIPPMPKVVIDNDKTKLEAIIKIKSISGSGERAIKVTNAGQITAQ